MTIFAAFVASHFLTVDADLAVFKSHLAQVDLVQKSNSAIIF